MRTVEVKSIATDKVVSKYYFYTTEQVKKLSQKKLPSGEYLIQGTNSMACKPRASKKAWESAEKFVIEKEKLKA